MRLHHVGHPRGRKGWGLPLLLLLGAALAGCSHPADLHSASETVPTSVPRVAEPLPALELGTDAGVLTLVLYPQAAPRTVALIEDYVREGYYVGRTFTRTVPGHVIQVSDAAGGATDDPRRVPLETHPDFHFAAGAAGIARDTDPGSGGPEFFIMDYATSHLDGNYTVWGQVVSGLDVVHDIASRPAVDSSQVPQAPQPPGGVPVGPPFDREAVVPVRITSARLLSLRADAAVVADYPLRVARNQRVGDLRHSLEWPRSLSAGNASDLVWYVRPYNGAALPRGDLSIREGDQRLALRHARDGIYPFTWRPATPGHHGLAFWEGDRRLATLDVDVPSAAPAPALLRYAPDEVGGSPSRP